MSKFSSVSKDEVVPVFTRLIDNNEGKQVRFSARVLLKRDFTEKEIFSLWCLGQILGYSARHALKEAIYALTGAKISGEKARCDACYWVTLGQFNNLFSDIVLMLFQCIEDCRCPESYMSLFSGTWLHLSTHSLPVLDDEQILSVLSFVFNRGGRGKLDVHLRELGTEVKQIKIPEKHKCPHYFGPYPEITYITHKKKEKVATPGTPSTPSNTSSASSSTSSPLIPLPAIPMIKPGSESSNLFALTEEEAQELEREEAAKARPMSTLERFMQTTSLRFLSHDGALRLLSGYNKEWEKEVGKMGDEEKFGTMEFMCTTMILEQLQFARYDKNRVQMVWPERRCAIQKITDGVVKKLSIDKSVSDMIKETYNMSRVLYMKAISEGKIVSDLHGGTSVRVPPTPDQPAAPSVINPQPSTSRPSGIASIIEDRVQPADQPEFFTVRPPFKPGFIIVNVGSGFMYQKL